MPMSQDSRFHGDPSLQVFTHQARQFQGEGQGAWQEGLLCSQPGWPGAPAAHHLIQRLEAHAVSPGRDTLCMTQPGGRDKTPLGLPLTPGPAHLPVAHLREGGNFPTPPATQDSMGREMAVISVLGGGRPTSSLLKRIPHGPLDAPA